MTIESVAKSPVIYQMPESTARPVQAVPVTGTEQPNVEHMDVESNEKLPEISRNIAQEGTRTIADSAGQSGNGKAVDQQSASNNSIRKAVEELNKRMMNSEAIFGIHEATKRLTIKIVDRDTKEVIREFPPEKTLDMIAKVWELAGVMVDEKR